MTQWDGDGAFQGDWRVWRDVVSQWGFPGGEGWRSQGVEMGMQGRAPWNGDGTDGGGTRDWDGLGGVYPGCWR